MSTLLDQVREALEKQRESGAVENFKRLNKHLSDEKNVKYFCQPGQSHTYDSFRNGADSRTEMILKLVAAIEEENNITAKMGMRCGITHRAIADLKRELGIEGE